jgi:uncharacterized damage-inducible protein DinB
MRGESARVAVWPALDLAGCETLAVANHAALTAFLSTLDETGFEQEIAYTNSAGQAFRSKVRDILLQIALHGCYHRGQVALLLREAGAEPQATDYIALVRGAPAATRRT